RIELLEFDEEPVEVLWADADAGILYLEAEARVALSPYSNGDVTLVRRELQRVRQVVVEHLLQLGRIDHDPVDSGIDLAGQTNRLLNPPILLLELLVLSPQLLLELLLLSDVLRDQHVADRTTIGVVPQRHGDGRSEPLAVLAHAVEDTFGLAHLQRGIEERLH